MACRSSPGDELDLKARAALYVEYLSDLPAKYLQAAIDEWIRTNVFFPAISELRAMAQAKARTAWQELEHLRRREQRKREAAEDAKRERPTQEQMDELKAKIAERWAR